MITAKKVAKFRLLACAKALFGIYFLAACSALPVPPMQAVEYDFGLAPLANGAPQPAQVHTPQAQGRAPVVLAAMESPGIPEGSAALQYRLAYDSAQQLRAYQQARWSQPPADLVQQAVASELAQHRPVLSGGAARAAARNSASGTLVLRLELQEFSQIFTSPAQSAGVLRLRATLAESRAQGDVLRAQRVFATQVPATSADAAGGSAALADAAARTARELAQWVEQAAH